MTVILSLGLAAALFGGIFLYSYRKSFRKQTGCNCSSAGDCNTICAPGAREGQIVQIGQIEEKNSIKLTALKPGDEAVVIGYEQHNPVYRSKLLSMGLTRGTPLRFVKAAPFGDPVEIYLRGFKLSLRKQEAEVLKLRRVK